MAALRKKMADVNKRLGEKFEISDSELQGTFDACRQLMAAGEDLDSGAGASQASERILAEEEEKERRDAAAAAEGGGEGASPQDALQEMGKLNTARIRKAVDPKVLDVKKRVRAARRSLKRESKVQLSDEIIFFDDVAGNEQAKVELMEVVDFFRRPEKFRTSGAKPPKGVLLVGPPGNGKTLMARAVAGESGVAFISSSASEFIEMYMGLGAARVRDLFNTARKLAPCIIFIDELDAVGRARRSGAKGGNDERDNTVNQLLTELDGFEAERTGIVIMGATNRKDVLDAALTRPGRFDRSIEVTRPDYRGRLEAIKVHLRDKPIAADLDYPALATLTGGMSGAQIAGVANAACFIASREGRSEVGQADLAKAIEQQRFGKSYEKTGFVSPARKRRFAVMEASISLAATLLPAIEPVDHVTIVPSAKSPLGRTVLEPHIGRYTTGVWTKAYLKQQLLLALAGRAGEEIVYGLDGLSSLNQARLQLARQISHKMLNAGMSAHPDFENIRTLGHNYMDPSMEQSRWTQYTVTTDANQSRSEWVDTDMELEDLLNGGYEEVKALLSRNRAALDALTEALLDSEKLPGARVREIAEANGHAADLEARRAAAGAALI
ncbi:cell division protein [Raphidocelis subcapitata]|uniref:Cell division protein n=1 Tax=Raphidocelis subcapitata TaxID=307507 RepID=A0A2V0NTR5_9CHLO|nr:cell division protein [Raphidocelis subcapitata]|eukprot:GBF88960.1 cell division protein [Raphidocelis subcapitata]